MRTKLKTWVALLVMVLCVAVTGNVANAETVNIDLGWTGNTNDYLTTDAGWNNISSPLANDGETAGTGIVLENAIDSTGAATTLDVNVIVDFFGTNRLANADKDAAVTNFGGFGFPQTAQQDSFFLKLDSSAQFRFEGLTPGEEYDLTLLGYRNRSDRGTQITVTGAGTPVVASYDADDPTPYVQFSDVEADANGYLTVDALQTTGDFGYLGVIRIEGNIAPVPEPSTLVLLLAAVASLLLFRRQ